MKATTYVSLKIEDKKFPKMMISNKGAVVLFLSYENGVVIDPGNSNHDIGFHYISWDMNDFADFEGSVKIENH